MKAFVKPSKPSGKITVPPSKSMAHRALICAGLADGVSYIENVDFSDDILATIDGLKAIGANITVTDDKIIVKGIHDFSKIENLSFNAKESGSTLRFMIPIYSLFNKDVSIYGSKKLISRPLDVYKDIFNDGIEIAEDKINISKSIKSDYYNIKGDISSQFISGLLFSLPLLEHDSVINIIPPFESKSYIDLTIYMLNQFGIKIDVSLNKYYIKGNQKYHSTNYVVEGDYSQAAFYMVLSKINSPITINGLNEQSLQGDKIIKDLIKSTSNIMDIKDSPDLGPILCVYAATKDNVTTTIDNTSRLRMKESDRVLSMELELQKLGVSFKSYQNQIIIEGQTEFDTKLQISSHNDHRICMSMAIIATISKNGLLIDGIECVNKSYPNFFKDLESLGIGITYHE